MAYISERTIKEVREASDVVEVISSYLPLKKTGSNYKCLCPFHSEKTPSFIVNPERQIFHCFGCQTGGNVFTFVMKMENITFPESVIFLAEKAGIRVESAEGSEEKKNLRRTLLGANNAAVDYFHHNLTRTKKVTDYLAKRGINESSIKKFKLGYAQNSPDALKNALKKEGFTEDVLFKSGLLRYSEEKDFYYDYFRNRIIFPIFNPRGECLAFGGRVLEDTAMPKYLNSSESFLYHKGKVLYGLSLAKEAINRAQRVIIVEGYFDLIKVSQAGLKNVVAPLGTALTLEHIRLLRRWTENIVLCPDGDAAGGASACRGLELLLEEGLKVKVMVIPEGYDPDSYISEKGVESFQALLAHALDPFDYKMGLLAQKNDINTIDGKLLIAEELLALIAKLDNRLERAEYLKRLAGKMKLDEDDLKTELRKILVGKPRFLKAVVENATENKNGAIRAQEILIRFSLEEREILEKVTGLLSPDDFTGIYRKIFDKLLHLFQKTGKVTPSDLISSLGDELEAGEIISSLLLKREEFSPQMKGKMVDDCIRKLKKGKVEKKLEYLKDLIKEEESRGEVNTELLAEYQHFSKLHKAR